MGLPMVNVLESTLELTYEVIVNYGIGSHTPFFRFGLSFDSYGHTDVLYTVYIYMYVGMWEQCMIGVDRDQRCVKSDSSCICHACVMHERVYYTGLNNATLSQ
jgi:hypothetical protein